MFFVCFGIIILIGSLIWLFFPTIKKFLKKFRSDLNENIQIENNITEDEESENAKVRSKFDSLCELEQGQTIRYLNDKEELESQIEAVVVLKPLFQPYGSPKDNWDDKPEQPSLLVVTDSFWILNIPSQEGSERVWLMMNLVKGNYGGLRNFYLYGGSDETKKGPARKFKENKQMDSENYSFPESWKLFPGKSFFIVDIGAFEASEVNGDTRNRFSEGGFFSFVTSKNENGDWLLLLDPRVLGRFKAGGNGAFLFGREIDEEYIEIPY